MIEAINSLFNAIKNFFGFFNSIYDYIVGVINLVKGGAQYIGNIFTSFSAILPASIMIIAGVMLSAAVLFKVLGR